MIPRECVTHFHACDCREAKFRALEVELAAIRKAALEVVSWDWEGLRTGYSHIDWVIAIEDMDALEKTLKGEEVE